ncbi:GNAT family N-acetyltransferase [Candidatus Nomurabacteria bacterium]|nr:GNAT family N-acetyltransferase [Candidatus Nomurabacteria bacterium]
MSISKANLALKPYSLHHRSVAEVVESVGFIRGLRDLVAHNTEELAVDFPNVPERYRTMYESAKSVRRAINNPDLDAFAIVHDPKWRIGHESTATFFENLISDSDTGGTLWIPTKPEPVGVATLVGEEVDPKTAYAAWWVDKDRQNQGVGTFAASALVLVARQKGLERVNAYVRPENEPSTSVVEELGFKAVGKSAVVDLGDNVTAPRQKFSLELA